MTADWIDHEAASFAVKRWHYSHSMPMPPRVYIGFWEDSFIGAIIYARGASPYIASTFGLGLDMTEVCELTRVALGPHQCTTSSCVVKSIKMLREKYPELQLVVSYADRDHDHHGGIYQASNWLYLGIVTENNVTAWIVDGKKIHSRRSGVAFGQPDVAGAKLLDGAEPFRTKGKHKYVFPLTKKMRRIMEARALPYPRKGA